MSLSLKQWRNGYKTADNSQRWRPAYSDEYLNNPHKGTATFQRFEGDKLYPDIRWNDREGPLWFKPPRKTLKNKRYPPTRISYCRWLWNILEPERGKIRFDIIENALNAAAERNQTLQLRTQPFIWDSTPQWYWDLGGKVHRADSKAAGHAVPDHNHPLYLKHWGNHIRALGKRFDGHPALESFDVAYGGDCGETGGNCRRPMAEQLVDVYTKAFKKTQLIGMLGTDGNKYLASLNGNHGWRADCFGDVRQDFKGLVPDGLGWNHMQEAYPQEMFKDNVVDAWKTAPVTFETCWTVAYWEKQGWDIDAILEQGLKYHISVFMPKSVYIPDAWMDKIMEFNKKIGYRFAVHNMLVPLRSKKDQRIPFHITIDNKGIAPIYRNYTFALRIRQGKKHWIVPFKNDIRSWMPDYTAFKESITLPKQVARGTIELDCAIINDQNQPVVKLAHKERLKDGWHPISFMDIL